MLLAVRYYNQTRGCRTVTKRTFAPKERTKSEVLGYGEEEFFPWDLEIML